MRSQMKDQSDLTQSDFSLHPVWVRSRDYDSNESWYEETTEQTYRPWNGPLPIVPTSQFPFELLAASFRFRNGDIYLGYLQATTEEWDTPLAPRKLKDGSFTKPLQWSARRGNTPLSILALQHPVIFIDENPYGFHLRRDPEQRKQCVMDFYAAVGKRPEEVFPVEFSANPALFKGVVSGRIDGFYTFPLNKPFEIDAGESYFVAEA